MDTIWNPDRTLDADPEHTAISSSAVTCETSLKEPMNLGILDFHEVVIGCPGFSVGRHDPVRLGQLFVLASRAASAT